MGSMDGRIIQLLDGEWRTGETGNSIIPLDALSARLSRVLRIREGEEFCAVVPGERVFRLTAHYSGRRISALKIISDEPVGPRSGARIALFQALTQRSFDEALSLAARAGAWEVYPLMTERCSCGGNARPRLQRWKSIAAQAGEIARDLHGTVVGSPVAMPGAIDICTENDLAVFILSTSGEAGLLSPTVLRPIASRNGAAIFVGPEGGFTPDEERMAFERGAVTVTLGRRIIPADSAGGLSIFAILMALDQWPVSSGQWPVGSGQWPVGSGQWPVGSGK